MSAFSLFIEKALNLGLSALDVNYRKNYAFFYNSLLNMIILSHPKNLSSSQPRQKNPSLLWKYPTNWRKEFSHTIRVGGTTCELWFWGFTQLSQIHEKFVICFLWVCEFVVEVDEFIICNKFKDLLNNFWILNLLSNRYIYILINVNE